MVLIGDFNVDPTKRHSNSYEYRKLTDLWLQETTKLGLVYRPTSYTFCSLADDSIKTTLDHLYCSDNLFESVQYCRLDDRIADRDDRNVSSRI